jgi:site-specific DNA-methyltransferase (adenine-specific)
LLTLNKINHGDCLELLKQIEAHSIDLLITDPPYGMNFLSGQRVKHKHGKILNDDNLNWLEDFIIECQRILKPEAHSYIFCSHHNVDRFLFVVKKYLPYKNLLIWQKNNWGMGDLKGDYSPMYEMIIYSSNGKKKLNGKRSKNILEFNRTGNKLHPTEKPTDLYKFLIEKSSKEGDIILDPFAGSCPAAIAAIDTKRNWICMEKDKHYHKVGIDRIQHHLKASNEVS